MANVLCVLYDDPVDGYPPSYARDQIPKIERYNDGQSTPTPEAIGFTGRLRGRRLVFRSHRRGTIPGARCHITA
jgi:hypothetical protein